MTSPIALYTEAIMRSIDDMGGIKMGDTVINNIRNADDTVIISEVESELQQLMDAVPEQCQVIHYGILEV